MLSGTQKGLKLGDERSKQKKGKVRWTSIVTELPHKMYKKL